MKENQKQITFRLTNKKLIEGFFLRRLNRFVIECKVNGKKTLAHLPNPGRLWELLFKDSKILLYANNPFSTLKYTVAAVYKDAKPVLLHTIKTNSVAEWLIKNSLIEELKDYRILSKEKIINNSRIDFFLTNGREKFFLEVKSCTLFHNKIAMFPDAVSERGTKHLKELVDLKNNFQNGGILLLVHNFDAEYFLPEYHTDLRFAQNFYNLKDKLRIIVYGLNWDNGLTLYPSQIKKLKIPFDILENELFDSGTYILIIYNEKKQKIEIGNIGLITFDKGYYCYVGSALQNLSKRIERHKRKNKRFHWHIDYFLDKTKIYKALEIRGVDKLECEIALSLQKISDGSINNFGSSDCNCFSHLFYFKENPIHQKKFIDLILYFRMERLIKKYNL